LSFNGPNSKVLLSDQSVRTLPKSTLTNPHLNFSLGVNSVSSNLKLAERVNYAFTPYLNSSLNEVGLIDKSLMAYTTASPTYTSTAHPALQTSQPNGSTSLTYDQTYVRSLGKAYDDQGALYSTITRDRTAAVSDVFIGSREKTPKSVNSVY
jgi:hypothetical protein